MSDKSASSSGGGSRRRLPKPDWLKVQIAGGSGYREIRSRVTARGLHTVCDEARCPNRGECFGKGVATIMVLGRACTRGCRFCAVSRGAELAPPDPEEPALVAEAVDELGLRYVVLTMVTRDDLPDGGAAHVVACVQAIAARCPGVGIEVLGSDFGGDREALRSVACSGVAVVAHNVETVRRLTPLVRHRRCDYDRSLEVLRLYRDVAPLQVGVKSSLLVGLGETEQEVLETLEDVRSAGASLVTLGQYLQPSAGCWPVEEYVTPERFARYEEIGRRLHFDAVFAGPLVRSSYGAHEQYQRSLVAGT